MFAFRDLLDVNQARYSPFDPPPASRAGADIAASVTAGTAVGADASAGTAAFVSAGNAAGAGTGAGPAAFVSAGTGAPAFRPAPLLVPTPWRA